jgi:hypothetical protein
MPFIEGELRLVEITGITVEALAPGDRIRRHPGDSP